MLNRKTYLAASVALGSLLLSACGGSNDPPAGAHQLSFKLTDAGCDPARADAPAGPITFDVTNDGAAGVTELEVLDGDSILGERENLSDGLSGSFTLTLDAGSYVLYCPGGDSAERGTLTVTGEPKAAQSAEATAAVDDYRRFIEEQTAILVDRTQPFVDAVQSGNVQEAKDLYADSRLPYERVEPVAESFGNLDPEIDARAGDVPAAQWGGYHRIEKALWVDDTTQGMGPVAAKLLADVQSLQARVRTIKLQPAQIANGANELLGEISSSKITGEEERYSHTDLWDFQANVEGAKAAFDADKKLLEAKDPELASEIEQRFADVEKALEPYERGDGYVLYGELSEQDKRRLAQSIDALGEPLSQVAAIVAQQ
ncbi:MAG TPA: iron uptake system protein EfeO [Solirubrobacterales bacterium]